MLGIGLLMAVSAFAQQNILKIPETKVVKGKSVMLPVTLDNTTDIVAVEFTLTLPTELTLSTTGAKTTERTASHSVTIRQMSSGVYKVMIFSSSNANLIARTGQILQIPIRVSSSVADGTEFTPTMTDVVLSDKQGNDVTSSFEAGKIIVARSVDFEVSQVTIVENQIQPGGQLNVSWIVSNIGELQSEAGWRERVFFLDAQGNTALIGTVYNEDLLAGGGQMSRNYTFTVPEILGTEGEQHLVVDLVANSGSGEPESVKQNNRDTSSNLVQLGKRVYLSPAVASTEEVDNQNLRFQLSRSGSTAQDETFTLTNDGDTRLNWPTTVTIPAGQSGTYFYIRVTANGQVDYKDTARYSLTNADYGTLDGVIAIEDDTYPDLHLQAQDSTIMEGDTLMFVVSVDRAVSTELSLTLTSGMDSHFSIPLDLKIPAGQNNVVIQVPTVDDEVLYTTQEVEFRVSAPKYNPVISVVTLIDNDLPQLSLQLTPNAVSEGAGPLCLSARLKRLSNADKAVTIKFSDDSNGEIYYGGHQTLSLDKGVEEVDLNMGVIDNTTVDGDRTYYITAAVYMSSCSCSATTTEAGVVTVPLTIYDNDGPTLTMTASKSVLTEGSSLTVTLSRNTSTVEALTVNLACDHSSDLTLPTSVTIPAGKASVTFTVTSAMNQQTGDGYNAIITASASGFSNSMVWFTVSDQTLPDAQISRLTLSASEAVVGTTVTAQAILVNMGNFVLPQMTTVDFYFADNSSVVATSYLQQDLQPGDSVAFSCSLTMPMTIGRYSCYAQVNASKKFAELSYTNNTSRLVSVVTKAPFSVSVGTDKAAYKQGDTVTITGQLTGLRYAMEAVEVYVINSNYRNTISVTTDSLGRFSTSYVPYSGQVGHFTVGADYSGEYKWTEMAGFDVYGLRLQSYGSTTCDLLLGDDYIGEFYIVNPGTLAQSGLQVTVLKQPDDCSIKFQNANNIAAGESLRIGFTLHSDTASTGDNWLSIPLQITTAEGAVLTKTIYYYCTVKKGQLQASVSQIRTTMIKGQSRDYTFSVTNIGKGETGKITLSLPSSWMTLATPQEMSSLQHGESADIVLRLTPTDEMQLNVPRTGTIGINCKNGKGISLPFSIEPVSETSGTLTVDVCDENTYYSVGGPHLKGAAVTINHPTTNALLASGTTDSTGKFSVVLPEGYYVLNVSAEKHESYRNYILVDPGTETLRTVNLSYNAITTEWSVVETETEDKYIVKTTVTYETNVPVPVVVISAPDNLEADKMQPGESKIFNVILTNKGLVTALQTELTFPEEGQTWTMTPLASTGKFDIPANQSVTIPILFTNLADNTSNASGRISNIRRAGDGTIYSDCMAAMNELHKWLCGEELKENQGAKDIATRECLAAQILSPLADELYKRGIGVSGIPQIEKTEGGRGGSGSGGDGTVSGGENGGGVNNGYGDGICNHEVASALSSIESVGLGAGSSVMGSKAPDIVETEGILEKTIAEYNKNGHVSFGTVFDIVEKIGLVKWGADKIEDEVTGVWHEVVHYARTCSDLKDNFQQLKGFLDDIGFKYTAPARKTAGTGKYAWMLQFNNSAAMMMNYLDAYLGEFAEIFGDEVWYIDINQTTADFYQYIYEHDSLTLVDWLAHKPDNVTDEQATQLYNRLKGLDSQNAISVSRMDSLSQYVSSLDAEANADGYVNYYEQFGQDLDDYLANLRTPSNSMCAQITLQFSQSMVMTRQAFRGTLKVTNGNDEGAMTNVRLNLHVYDTDGVDATSHEFQINCESVTGFTGANDLTSGWTLAANGSGVVSVLFIPTKYAAPMTDKMYYFGGTLSYVDPNTGLETSRELNPVLMTVKPSPNLDLTYFMQRDIFGDDAMTLDVVEPSVDAEFSLLIHNVGYGDATNVKMTTDQPEITENEKGLAVDFELMSSQLNGGEKTLALGNSVVTDFGTIPAQRTTYAQWWLRCSLLGHFTTYNVEATHVTSYNNPDLSLLNDVTIHELIRSLEVPVGDSSMVGFMTNDISDAYDQPDMLYLSNGDVEGVSAGEVSIQRLSTTSYRLTVKPSKPGWNYGNVLDPTYGASEIKSVVRESDSKQMPLRNFWQTDRTLRDGHDPLYENRIHCADDFSSFTQQTYLLTFDPVPNVLLSVEKMTGMPAEDVVAVKDVDSVSVTFNKSIDPSTFTSDDITLLVQGEKQDASKIDITTMDNKTFILDLRQINADSPNGYYVLQVQTAEITDTEGYQGKTGKSVNWILFRGGLISMVKSVYPANSGTIAYEEQSEQAPARSVMGGTEISTASLTYGQTYVFTAAPKPGYTFSNWTVNGESVSNDSMLTYTVLSDVNIVANFNVGTHMLTIDDSIKGGSISGIYTGIYDHGTMATLTASSTESYYSFSHWTINGRNAGTSDVLNLSIDSDMVISCVFTRDISAQMDDQGKVVYISGTVDKDFLTLLNQWLADNRVVCAVDFTSASMTDRTSTIVSYNPNVLYYILPYQKVLNATNVVSRNSCDNYVLVDQYPIFVPSTFTSTAASYTRSPESGTWGTLCLPFSVSSDESVQFYQLTKITDAVMRFEPVATTEPNTPLVFKRLSASGLQFSVDRRFGLRPTR